MFISPLFFVRCHLVVVSCQVPHVEVAGIGPLRHPKAPSPPPRREDTPSTSTFVSLELEKGVWDIVVDNNSSDAEVRRGTGGRQQKQQQQHDS